MKKTLLYLIVLIIGGNFILTSGFVTAQNQANNTPAIVNTEKWKLEDARPNPAREHTWINFTLPEGTQNARIIVRNLVGTTVISESITPGSERIRLNTQELNNGIYIYSLMVDNQLVASKRLIITK